MGRPVVCHSYGLNPRPLMSLQTSQICFAYQSTGITPISVLLYPVGIDGAAASPDAGHGATRSALWARAVVMPSPWPGRTWR